MNLYIAEWVHAHTDLLLGLALIALAFAFVLVQRIREESRRIDVITAVLNPPVVDEPPVDAWADALEDGPR